MTPRLCNFKADLIKATRNMKPEAPHQSAEAALWQKLNVWKPGCRGHLVSAGELVQIGLLPGMQVQSYSGQSNANHETESPHRTAEAACWQRLNEWTADLQETP